jgi:hypothetical protein
LSPSNREGNTNPIADAAIFLPSFRRILTRSPGAFPAAFLCSPEDCLEIRVETWGNLRQAPGAGVTGGIMTNPTPPLDEDSLAQADAATIHRALFEQLVAGHGQMVLMFLGILENPHSGAKEAPQPEAAKLFIDQLEMLQVKTRGNLSPEESELLERTLAVVHRGFADFLDAQPEQEPTPGPAGPDPGVKD